jgi:putative phage-type endonuclease
MLKREMGIGGTDIAAIMGVHKYKTAHDVFMDKTGRSAPLAMNEAMYWGLKKEPIIADRYQEDHPEITLVRDLGIMKSPKHDWWLGSPDGQIEKGGNVIRGLEIKTGSVYRKKEWGDEGTDHIPREYLMQCMWYMPLLGVNEMHVAVLLGQRDYTEFVVKRDNDLLTMMYESGKDFWENYVKKDMPPPTDGSDACKDYMSEKYPEASDDMLDPDDGIHDLAARYNGIKTQIGLLEEEQEKLKNIFKKEIGEKKGFTCDDWRVTWTNRKSNKKTDWVSVEGHFVRTLEKSGVDVEEAQSIVQKIIKYHTTGGVRSEKRAFTFRWKGE